MKYLLIIARPTHLDEERHTDSEDSDSSDEGFSETELSKSEYKRIWTSNENVRVKGGRYHLRWRDSCKGGFVWFHGNVPLLYVVSVRGFSVKCKASHWKK